MIHRVPYIENLKIKYSELLKSCLGKRLVSARRRFYKFDDDIDVTHPDTSEVVLFFDSTTLYFCWEQFDDEFDLSIGDKTHLIDGQFFEGKAEDDNILSKVLGKSLTLFELYEDKFGSVEAALLRFEDESLVLAIGHSEWDANEQQEEFKNFYGDDLYLWTLEDFQVALHRHKLEIAISKSISNV